MTDRASAFARETGTYRADGLRFEVCAADSGNLPAFPCEKPVIEVLTHEKITQAYAGEHRQEGQVFGARGTRRALLCKGMAQRVPMLLN